MVTQTEKLLMDLLTKRQLELEPLKLTDDVKFECRLIDTLIDEIKCICDDEDDVNNTNGEITRN